MKKFLLLPLLALAFAGWVEDQTGLPITQYSKHATQVYSNLSDWNTYDWTGAGGVFLLGVLLLRRVLFWRPKGFNKAVLDPTQRYDARMEELVRRIVRKFERKAHSKPFLELRKSKYNPEVRALVVKTLNGKHPGFSYYWANECIPEDRIRLKWSRDKSLRSTTSTTTYNTTTT
jgi:hypothetical protein